MSYVPTTGSVPARAIEFLQAMPEGSEVPSGILAEHLGQQHTALAACLEIAVKHGLITSRKETNSVRSVRLWRLGTEAEKAAAEAKLIEKRQAAEKQRRQEIEEAKAHHRLTPAPTPGPAGLPWKPAKPLYTPPPDEDEAPATVKQDLTPEPTPTSAPEKINTAQREQHLASRAWFSSDGQLVVEAGEIELVFGRLEARQLVRAIRELGEAWA